MMFVLKYSYSYTFIKFGVLVEKKHHIFFFVAVQCCQFKKRKLNKLKYRIQNEKQLKESNAMGNSNDPI